MLINRLSRSVAIARLFDEVGGAHPTRLTWDAGALDPAEVARIEPGVRVEPYAG